MFVLCRKMAGLISIWPVVRALKARVILARSSTPIAERAVFIAILVIDSVIAEPRVP